MQISGRPVLLLGASGFLGRHIAQVLAGEGCEVRPVSRRDAMDVPRLAGRLLSAGRTAVLVNAAGCTSGEPAELVAGNVTLLDTLLRACALGRPGIRLVHLGSAAEYTPDVAPLTEQSPTGPVTAYGRTKLLGSQRVVAASQRGWTDGVVLRVFEPLGVGQPATSLPGALLRELAVAGPGTHLRVRSIAATRDYVSARDVGRAVLAAATHSDAVPPVVNIASGRTIPIRQLAQMIIDRSGLDVTLDAADQLDLEGHTWQDSQQADIALAATSLAWRPVDTVQAAVDGMLPSRAQ